jgi:hypothetical protein
LWDQKWRETGGKSWKLMEFDGHIMENDGNFREVSCKIWCKMKGNLEMIRDIS